MTRGEIYYADLGRTVGSQINKRRPILIVSNDANNRAAGPVTVLPIISNISRVYPFELLIDPKEAASRRPRRFRPNRSEPLPKRASPRRPSAGSRWRR